MVANRMAEKAATTPKIQTKYTNLWLTEKSVLFGAKKTSEGKEYFSGVISDLRGEIQIVVFRNDKKENENQPDYTSCYQNRKKRWNIRRGFEN